VSNILVTGCLGAVGTPLWKSLASRGHNVRGVDLAHSHLPQYDRCDVGEYRQLQRVFDALDIEYVYHLAAEFGRNNGETYYENLWRTNVIGTKHLLRLQEERRFKMVLFSSSEVYGDWPEVMSEDVMDLYPIRQMNDYAITKWVNELQVLNSADRSGTETVRVRLFNTYGPGEPYSPWRSVVCMFVYHALHDLPYTVYLDHRRTSTYIDDSVRALAAIADNFRAGDVYNIAGDDYHDIKTLSDIVLRQLGKDDSQVTYLPAEAHNTRDKKADNSRARQHLGLQTTVTLEEGIRRTIEWQKQVYSRP
jgi:dTDP-glucose 4,6-dehydratase